MRRSGSLITGLILIGVGGLFLLGNLNIPGFNFGFGTLVSWFWPLFIIVPGLMFHASYFDGKVRDAGVLVPGGIFLTVGLTCQLSTLLNMWGVFWPGFILAPAVGLFELYWFGRRERGLLIPVGILGGLSAIFFCTFSVNSLFGFNLSSILVPGIIILIGLRLVTRNRPNRS